MSKRHIILFALAVLFALSVVAFAAMPEAASPAAPADDDNFASLEFEIKQLDHPDCPGPTEPGCGGT
jgi:hypothetical protein